MSVQAQKRRILVIDDDITSLDIVSFLFEDRGYQVERCAAGEQALELLKTVEVSLVLVDLMMPGLDGIATVEQLRALGFDTIPVVAFTANEDPQYLEKARAAGCSKVLVKPLRPKQLIAEIEQILP